MLRTFLPCLMLLAASAHADQVIDRSLLAPLPNVSFHESDRVASGRLKPDDIAVLARAGIRNVIDLSDDSETPDFDEASAVRAAGMDYDNLPIHGADDLSEDNVRRFDALVAAAGNRPTLIHCASSNRVGALMALRAANLQGASAEIALETGKAWGLTKLEPAVRERLASRVQVATAREDAAAQTLQFPRIKSAGGVYALPGDVDMPAAAAMHRVVIDATEGETTGAGINRRLEAAARAVNLYALAGVPADKLKVAVVIHGKATPIVLSDASYRTHFAKANPDATLIADLRAAGVELYVCGQALRHSGYAATDVRKDVRVALSAMTRLVDLQAAGYSLVP